MKRADLRILALGAGVQSTTVALMAERFDIDCAVFSDTGDEPKQVYTHLRKLKRYCSIPIHKTSKGNLGDDLLQGMNSTGQRYVSIPVYSQLNDGGLLRRQCTVEYKINPMKQFIKRELLGLKPRQCLGGIRLVILFGISTDEAGRADRIADNTFQSWNGHTEAEFPLLDIGWSRGDCHTYLSDKGWTVPRSACVYCPYRSNREWSWLKENDPEGFQRAIDIDEAIRYMDKKKGGQFFVHKSRQPLKDASFDDPDFRDQFQSDCQGMCGN